MKAEERLLELQNQLVAAGARDIKFAFDITAENVQNLTANVVEVLEAVVAGDHSPLEPFGDSYRTRNQNT